MSHLGHRRNLLCVYVLQGFMTSLVHHRTDGWITCDFTSFSTVFQSHQDKKAMCNETTFTIGKISASGGARTGTARSEGQRLTY